MEPVEKAADAVVEMKPVEEFVTVTQAGVENKGKGKRGTANVARTKEETTEAVVEIPTEKENPDVKAPEAGIEGKGKGEKGAARVIEDVKATQADKGKGKCEHDEAIEAAATVEGAKKPEGGHHLLEVCSVSR